MTGSRAASSTAAVLTWRAAALQLLRPRLQLKCPFLLHSAKKKKMADKILPQRVSGSAAVLAGVGLEGRGEPAVICVLARL